MLIGNIGLLIGLIIVAPLLWTSWTQKVTRTALLMVSFIIALSFNGLTSLGLLGIVLMFFFVAFSWLHKRGETLALFFALIMIISLGGFH
jgi:hypothetical protein